MPRGSLRPSVVLVMAGGAATIHLGRYDKTRPQQRDRNIHPENGANLFAAARSASLDRRRLLRHRLANVMRISFRSDRHDRVKELSARDPAMGERQPFKALLEQDYKVIFGLGRQALLELAFATHPGITDEHFARICRVACQF
jgi:hypothetical protein